MSFIFTAWRSFLVILDKGVTQAYLRRMGARAEREFKNGISSPKTGRVYRRSGGRVHRASAPGEFPAKDSGAHVATVAHKVGKDSVIVGSGMHYAKYLRNGTSKMARRRMSDDALRAAMEKDTIGVGRFARFRYV
jgi:hypothetical protein